MGVRIAHAAVWASDIHVALFRADEGGAAGGVGAGWVHGGAGGDVLDDGGDEGGVLGIFEEDFVGAGRVGVACLRVFETGLEGVEEGCEDFGEGVDDVVVAVYEMVVSYIGPCRVWEVLGGFSREIARKEDLPLLWSVFAFVVLGTYKAAATATHTKKGKTVEKFIMVEMGFQSHPVARMILYLPLIEMFLKGQAVVTSRGIGSAKHGIG